MSEHRAQQMRGFTLVEALVALTLMTVGLIPAFLQATESLKLSLTVKNTLIAGHLAQEGVEIVRSMRDANWFSSAPFSQGLTDCATGCIVDYTSVQPTDAGTNPPLLLDALTGMYQYTTGDPSPFRRRITIVPVATTAKPGQAGLRIATEITWTERKNPKTFTLESYLFDWY